MFDDDLQLALKCSDIAGALALEYFERGVRSDLKADGCPVTEADRAVEDRLREELASASPGDAILGEEFGLTGSSNRVWVLDPIDGTSCFAVNDPHWRVQLQELRQQPTRVGALV